LGSKFSSLYCRFAKHIDKQTILEQIFVTAADADANYRNFIKRTLDAIARLIEDSEANSEAEKILKS
jgi:hypothetical protein